MTDTTLKLENAQALLRKISNNLLNFGDEKITAFTLPIEGVPLNQEQLDAIMGLYTFRSWYNQRSDGVWVPCEWWAKRKKRDFRIDDEFDCEAATITVSGEQELEFEEYEPEGEDAEPTPAARITDIVLTPQDGGITLMAFHMHVRPGIGKTNLLLQEHQHRYVTITLGDTTLVKGKQVQGSLPFGFAGIPDPPQQKPAEQPHPDEPEHPTANSDGEGGPASPESEPMTATQVLERQDSPPPTAEQLQEFESAAAAQVAAFNAQPGDLIDGRSERVKQQDRRRRRDAAH